MYIQHGDTNPPYNAMQLGKGFKNFIIENHNTTTFLSSLSKIICRRIQVNNFDWQYSFKKNTISDDKGIIKNFLICKVANMLGISIDKIEPSAYLNAFQIKTQYETVDFHKTLAIVQRTRGDSKKEKLHDTTVMTKETDLLGYYYSQGNYKKALKYAISLDDLVTDASNTATELDWSTYTSMSAHCRPLIMKYLRSPFAKPPISESEKIRKLIKLTDILGNRALQNVRFINQIATALRFHFLFKAVTGNNDIFSEKTVLHLYGEGASIVGYVSAFRDIAIKNYFLAKHNRNKSFFKDAQMYMNKSYELANLIGDHSGMKRAKTLEVFFKFLKPLYW
jgi:hypothetical protein